ncbi:MAG TPA: hypothetical protein PK668_25585 [Myxococcota bacterium]|nr:hypothetical protein [Myxococcota bacterium]HRY96901.1 hypothetical protein [Myxococcota bacterium]
MPSLTVRMSRLLYSRIQAASAIDCKSLSEAVRALLEEALVRRNSGGSGPATMEDLRKLAAQWERLCTAILMTEQSMDRSLEQQQQSMDAKSDHQ